jgi:hypothetical protein
VPALAAPAVQATRRRGILSDRRGLNIFPRSGAVGPNRDIAPPVTSFENECESSSQSSRAVADGTERAAEIHAHLWNVLVIKPQRDALVAIDANSKLAREKNAPMFFISCHKTRSSMPDENGGETIAFLLLRATRRPIRLAAIERSPTRNVHSVADLSGMPRYFFHLEDGERIASPADGMGGGTSLRVALPGLAISPLTIRG